MSTRLEALLDKIAQTSPSSLIVLAQITPLGYTSAPLTAYNAKIPGIVQSHAAKGQHIVGVDMSKMPVPADIASDNVHPNDQGYVYMANIWYAAIKASPAQVTANAAVVQTRADAGRHIDPGADRRASLPQRAGQTPGSSLPPVTAGRLSRRRRTMLTWSRST